jgi:hypothetical protein
MPREDMFAMGRLRPVDQPTAAPVPHPFDQVSRLARADPRLSARGFRVYCTLEGYCFGDDRECWPSNRTIGKNSGGVGPEAVRRALRELEKLGYLEVIPDPRRYRGQRLRITHQLRKPERPVYEDDED